jgi:hypothetical protein
MALGSTQPLTEMSSPGLLHQNGRWSVKLSPHLSVVVTVKSVVLYLHDLLHLHGVVRKNLALTVQTSAATLKYNQVERYTNSSCIIYRNVILCL